MKHSHPKQIEKLVVDTLKALAKQKFLSYSMLKGLFTQGNEDITKDFWLALEIKSPNHGFNSVYFCPECKEFDLEKIDQNTT